MDPSDFKIEAHDARKEIQKFIEKNDFQVQWTRKKKFIFRKNVSCLISWWNEIKNWESTNILSLTIFLNNDIIISFCRILFKKTLLRCRNLKGHRVVEYSRKICTFFKIKFKLLYVSCTMCRLLSEQKKKKNSIRVLLNTLKNSLFSSLTTHFRGRAFLTVSFMFVLLGGGFICVRQTKQWKRLNIFW
jgi:hypothetical protein